MGRTITEEAVLVTAQLLWPDATLVETADVAQDGHQCRWRITTPLSQPGCSQTVAEAQTLECLLAKIELELEPPFRPSASSPTDPPRRISWFAPWRWKRRRTIVFAMLLVFVVYPLSSGPINRFVELGWLPQWVFFYGYLPLLILSDYNPLFRRLFLSYLYLCSPSCC